MPPRLGIHRSGQPEVEHLHLPYGVTFTFAGLGPMEDSLIVRRFEGPASARDRQGFIGGSAPAGAGRPGAVALDEFRTRVWISTLYSHP